MSVVIVGGGQGGFQAAASLRSDGYQERIVIVGEEAQIPYQRPPLSKGYLLGKQQTRHAILRPASFYETQNIELVTGQFIARIDRTNRRVYFADSQLEYDALVLATGARNRTLPVPGANLDGVCYLRTLAEAEEIRQRLEAAEHVVVIGGGFIGLEIAAVARTLNRAVTVIEAQPRVMARVVAPSVSEYFQVQHAVRGSEVALNTAAKEIRGEAGKVREVVLADGRRLAADLVVIGIGVVANTELARNSGLPIANGICVDSHLRTADERIFAIGDCAEYPSTFSDGRVRLESVQNAVDQAATVAKSITGHARTYNAVPWFWTDQYDIHLQIAGIADGFDQVATRGDAETHKFSTFYFRQGNLLAVDSINRPADHILARKLLATRTPVSADMASDESFDLKTLDTVK